MLGAVTVVWKDPSLDAIIPCASIRSFVETEIVEHEALVQKLYPVMVSC